MQFFNWLGDNVVLLASAFVVGNILGWFVTLVERVRIGSEVVVFRATRWTRMVTLRRDRNGIYLMFWDEYAMVIAGVSYARILTVNPHTGYPAQGRWQLSVFSWEPRICAPTWYDVENNSQRESA